MEMLNAMPFSKFMKFYETCPSNTRACQVNFIQVSGNF